MTDDTPDWGAMANPNVDNITLGNAMDQVAQANIEADLPLTTPQTVAVPCAHGCHRIYLTLALDGAEEVRRH